MIFFVILIVLACVILGVIILIQNPKGGGLAGNVGGFSNQLMGVKQTTDALEKGTWVMAVVVGLLCLFSAVFIPKTVSGSNSRVIEKVNAPRPHSSRHFPPGGGASARRQAISPFQDKQYYLSGHLFPEMAAFFYFSPTIEIPMKRFILLVHSSYSCWRSLLSAGVSSVPVPLSAVTAMRYISAPE